MLRLARFASHRAAPPAPPAPTMTVSEAIVVAERYLRTPTVTDEKSAPTPAPQRAKRAPPAPPPRQEQQQSRAHLSIIGGPPPTLLTPTA